MIEIPITDLTVIVVDDTEVIARYILDALYQPVIELLVPKDVLPDPPTVIYDEYKSIFLGIVCDCCDVVHDVDCVPDNDGTKLPLTPKIVTPDFMLLLTKLEEYVCNLSL